jgi:hypothetical protein
VADVNLPYGFNRRIQNNGEEGAHVNEQQNVFRNPHQSQQQEQADGEDDVGAQAAELGLRRSFFVFVLEKCGHGGVGVIVPTDFAAWE